MLLTKRIHRNYTIWKKKEKNGNEIKLKVKSSKRNQVRKKEKIQT